MRTFSFFNEKGGVGKSIHTIMFASFLAYRCGARVLVIDFEYPKPRLADIRKGELVMLEDPNTPLSRYLFACGRPSSFYPISSPFDNESYAYTSENAMQLRAAVWKLISSGPYDYILFDFPGMLIKNSPAYDCCVCGQVDLVAVPFDTDPITRKASLMTCSFMQKCGVDVVAFWNNVSTAELSIDGLLDVGEHIFNRFNIPVLPERIKSFVKARRDTNGKLFVRSTVCWPERYIQMACPALLDLYETLKQRLDDKFQGKL